MLTASCVLRWKAADTESVEPEKKVKPQILQRETLFGNLLKLVIIGFELESFVSSVFMVRKRKEQKCSNCCLKTATICCNGAWSLNFIFN